MWHVLVAGTPKSLRAIGLHGRPLNLPMKSPGRAYAKDVCQHLCYKPHWPCDTVQDDPGIVLRHCCSEASAMDRVSFFKGRLFEAGHAPLLAALMFLRKNVLALGYRKEDAYPR